MVHPLMWRAPSTLNTLTPTRYQALNSCPGSLVLVEKPARSPNSALLPIARLPHPLRAERGCAVLTAGRICFAFSYTHRPHSAPEHGSEVSPPVNHIPTYYLYGRSRWTTHQTPCRSSSEDIMDWLTRSTSHTYPVARTPNHCTCTTRRLLTLHSQ
jgi:hypothetical protein